MKLYTEIFFTLVFLLCFGNRGLAQYQIEEVKFWPSAIDYKLQGHVRNWVMKTESGTLLREMKFKTQEEFNKFQRETEPTRFSPDYIPKKLKFEYEKQYQNTGMDSTTKMVFNDQMQLLEKQNDSIHEINQFSADGQLLVHITSQTFSQLVVEPETRRYAESSYVYSYTKNFIMLYKYNEFGNLTQYEYYDSNPAKNLRIQYKYDKFNNLIESNKYTKSNIAIGYLKEDYFDKFFHSKIDSSFSIDQFFPGYWNESLPVKETWRYNNYNQKIEYISYSGYQQAPSFRANWNYDNNGLLMDEKHYDVSMYRKYYETFFKTECCVIVFDSYGNVVSETEYDPWNKTEKVYHYEIMYE